MGAIHLQPLRYSMVNNHSSYVQELAYNTLLRTRESVTTMANLQSAFNDLLDDNTTYFIEKTERLTSYQLNFIHAIIDAMLGAAGMDDIGTLFPDTDPSYCGADSAELLSQVVNAVASCGFHVCNLDTTVVLQSPKLGPYKAAIRERLASLIGVEPSRVGVKAKTAEGILGELGTGSAIMAQAVVFLGL